MFFVFAETIFEQNLPYPYSTCVRKPKRKCFQFRLNVPTGTKPGSQFSVLMSTSTVINWEFPLPMPILHVYIVWQELRYSMPTEVKEILGQTLTIKSLLNVLIAGVKTMNAMNLASAIHR